MTNNNDENCEIIFEGESDPMDIISEILKNNGLEETDEEYLEKTDQGKTPKTDIIYSTTKDLFRGKVSEKDLISSLKSQLETSEETAKNIVLDIKKRLLLMAKKVASSEQTSESEAEQPTTAKPVRLINDMPNEKEPIVKEKISSVIEIPEQKKAKTIKKSPTITAEKKEKEPVKQNNRQDTYRESTG